MAMMKGSNTTQETISYDQFIGVLDENLKRRHTNNAEDLGVEDSVINKIKEQLAYSGENLYQAMKLYDLEGSDNILVQDLPRVFKRIGISNIMSHIPMFHKIGGIVEGQMSIDIVDFSKKVEREIKHKTSKYI
jgi:Ca2+-binding EF-hand superfamily protein